MEISVVFLQMVQLFLIIALGYLLYKLRLFSRDLNQRLSRILLDVTLPATILYSVLSQTERPSGSSVLLVFVIAALMYFLFPFVSYALIRLLHFPKEDQGVYMFMSTYGNIGFMGIPVIEALFGGDAVFYTAIFNIMFNLSCFSVGIFLMHCGRSEKAKIKWKDLLSSRIISALIAILIYALDIHFPAVITDTVGTVSAVTTPLAMMLIGSTLATMPLREVFRDWHVYPFAVLRQILLPLLFWPLMAHFIKDPYLLGVTFVLFLMPTGSNSVLLATQYHCNEQLAAKTVFLTTVMSIVTIPLLIGICL